MLDIEKQYKQRRMRMNTWPDGDIYISETNHHVFVKGRKYTQEEWEDAVEKLSKKYTKK